MQDKIKYDKYGRIILEDEKLLKEISGAAFENYSDSNGACGDNGGCANAGCSNIE